MSNLHAKDSEALTICFHQEEDLTSVKEEVNILQRSFSPQFVHIQPHQLSSTDASSFDTVLNHLKQAKKKIITVFLNKGKYYILAEDHQSAINKHGKSPGDAIEYMNGHSNIKKVNPDSFNEDENDVSANRKENNSSTVESKKVLSAYGHLEPSSSQSTTNRANSGTQDCNRVTVVDKNHVKHTRKAQDSHVRKEKKERIANDAKVYQANLPDKKRKVTPEESAPSHSSAKKKKQIKVQNDHSDKLSKPQASLIVKSEDGDKDAITDIENEVFTRVVQKKKDESDDDYQSWLRERTNIPFNDRPGSLQVAAVYPAKKAKRPFSSGLGGGNPSSLTDWKPIQVSERERSTDLPSREQIVPSSVSTKVSIIPTTNFMTYSSEQVIHMRRNGIPARNRQKGPPPVARHPQHADAASRRASFRAWPASTHQDSGRMVDYGFFYTGRLDLVRCFQCGIGLKDWSEPDEPLFEHIKHSPDCPFLLQLLGVDLLSAYKVNLVPGNVQPAAARPPPVEDPREALGATGGVPSTVRAPQFTDIAARMRTFRNWPRDLTQTPLELAEAGFYYTGEDDLCRCFTCDGGLTRWDPQDDPWIQHAKHFPSCTYVRQVKGNEFVNLIQQAIASTDDEQETSNTGTGRGELVQGLTGLSLRPQSGFLDTPAAQAALEMGFSKKAVQVAVTELMSANKVNYTSQDIVEVLTRKMDAGEALPVDTPPNEESSQADHTNSAAQNEILCMKCKQREVKIIFLPCAHHRYCEVCAQNIYKCPVCQQDILEKITTFRG